MTNILRHKDRRSNQWKNGGGTTVEVVSAPKGASLSDFAWRVSIADVIHDGPFSEFEGVDRIIMVIEGAGLILKGNDVEQTLGPMRPFNFSGDLVTTARLIDGPTRDINIMTRRELVTADLAVKPVPWQKKVAVEVMKNEELVVIAASGNFSMRDYGAPCDALRATSRRASIANPVRTSLAPLDAFHQHGPSSFELSGDGVAVVVRLRNLIASISNL
jgi:environmental stress-induced protein Ves